MWSYLPCTSYYVHTFAINYSVISWAHMWEIGSNQKREKMEVGEQQDMTLTWPSASIVVFVKKPVLLMLASRLASPLQKQMLTLFSILLVVETQNQEVSEHNTTATFFKLILAFYSFLSTRPKRAKNYFTTKTDCLQTEIAWKQKLLPISKQMHLSKRSPNITIAIFLP